MKDKYQKTFTNYVKNTNITKGDKDFILDVDFINNNPDFYLFYPLLFSEYFEVEEEQVNLLSVAGYFYYQSTIFLDKVIDEKQLNTLFPSMVCQEEAVKILSSLFPLNSEFWHVWNKRKTNYKKAVHLENNISRNPSYEKYSELAALKSTFGNCAIDSLCYLSERTKKTTKDYEVLLKTHDYFAVAYQLNDDILDFINDYKNKQFNWAIHTFDQSYFKKYSIEDCKKVFYLEGYAANIFKLAIKELDKALLLLKDNRLSESLWFTHIAKMKLKFENSIIEIKNYLFQIEVETEKSNTFQKNNSSEKAILKGIEYIKKTLIKNQWCDYYNQGGISNVWSTAFVLSKIVSHLGLRNLFENEVQSASQFLLSSKSQNNMWGYSTTWIDDADSTNFALISLFSLGLLDNYNHDEWCIFFNGEYFSTYKDKNYLLESLADKNIKDVSGWCTSHHCVSAVSLYYLVISDIDTDKTKRLLDNFKSLNLEQITAYWWSDSIYTLYYLFLTFKKLNLNSESEKIQDYLSKKIKVDHYEDYFGINLFYTALALEIMLENPKYSKIADKLADFLIKNQYNDGSWLESNSLCIPEPNEFSPQNKNLPVKNFGVNVRSHEFNRLFTTISAIRSLYLWKNQN
jgi:hypothetical protein